MGFSSRLRLTLAPAFISMLVMVPCAAGLVLPLSVYAVTVRFHVAAGRVTEPERLALVRFAEISSLPVDENTKV